jgi:hypothetical protein
VWRHTAPPHSAGALARKAARKETHTHCMSANLVLSVLMVPVIRNKMTSKGSIACAAAGGIKSEQRDQFVHSILLRRHWFTEWHRSVQGADFCNCHDGYRYRGRFLSPVPMSSVTGSVRRDRDSESLTLSEGKADDDDDVFYLFLQKQKIGAELHIYLEEG